jgi:hypothetical protein
MLLTQTSRSGLSTVHRNFMGFPAAHCADWRHRG